MLFNDIMYLVADHEKDRERFNRSGTDRQRVHPTDGSAGDFRKLSTNPYREVGGVFF